MNSCHIPVIPYYEFSKRIHNRIAVRRVPIGGGIEPTFRCNLKCAHCYIAYDSKRKELSFEEVCHILDQIADAGCLWLLITGGEPLLREDFLDIYSYAKKKGLIITLFTNGTLITPEIADYLKDWYPFTVEITLHGITRETYEKVTGVPGSFERCMRGIKLLVERKIPLKLKTTVMTLNKTELWRIKRYAEKIGARFGFDASLNPRLDGSKKPCNLRLSPREVVELDIRDEGRSKEWSEFCIKSWGSLKSAKLYTCSAGVMSFHVNPYGDISICLMSRTPSYDLRQGSFKEAWYDFIPKVRAQTVSKDYTCRQCKLVQICDICPGWSRLENGDAESPVGYLCQIAHLRARAFGPKAE